MILPTVLQAHARRVEDFTVLFVELDEYTDGEEEPRESPGEERVPGTKWTGVNL